VKDKNDLKTPASHGKRQKLIKQQEGNTKPAASASPSAKLPPRRAAPLR
jgi:hypothetical protein